MSGVSSAFAEMCSSASWGLSAAAIGAKAGSPRHVQGHIYVPTAHMHVEAYRKRDFLGPMQDKAVTSIPIGISWFPNEALVVSRGAYVEASSVIIM